MWIHILIFICFCVLFLRTKGFFSKAGTYLAGILPDFLQLNSRQIRLLLIAVFCGNLLGTWVTGVFYMENHDGIEMLRRQESAYVEELYVTDGEHKEKLQIEVNEEPYSEAEKREILEKAANTLEEKILGENESLQKVEYPLKLMRGIVGTPVMVEWETDQPLILDWEGRIGEGVSDAGETVHLTALLSLEEETKIFETDVVVYPEKLSEKEKFIKEIESQIQIQSQEKGDYLRLPSEVDGKELVWEKADQYQGIFLIGIAILTGVLLVLCEKSRNQQIVDKRRWEMEMDYPGILSKWILFMQAGMSSRRALQKIVMDYKYDLERGRTRRVAYDELLKINLEMEQGISEEEAYRRLGNRCEVLSYRTLSTLLIQNLRKGSNYFISALKQECRNAFSERKRRAQMRGEEAGTKLLLPMGCMLLIVLVMILVPSMMTLG